MAREIQAELRALGPVIDPAAMKALYAPLLAQQPRTGAVVTPDVAYGSDPRHRVDIYTPVTASDVPRPVLVFIHGGGFIRGDKSERANLAHAFAQEGFVVLLPNYRLAPQHRWPAGAQDISALLRWWAAAAEDFGADPSRVVLGGESAGAAHVAAASLVGRLRDWSACQPVGVVLVSGVYNARLEGLARAQFGIATPDPRNEAYFGADRAAWDAMSTVELIDVPPFPLLITYAELDPPQMQVQAGELFARLVCRHGFQPSLQVIRDHNHLSQLYAIGAGDRTLFAPLLDWIRRVTLREPTANDNRHP